MQRMTLNLGKLKEMRKTKGLTQEELGAKLNLSINGYSMIERGERRITLDRAMILARIFEVTIEELFFDNKLLETSN